MSSLSVRNRAQSLFPDGLQDSMILRNDGPYTVYVDNDATVNALSHAIPPTGTMAWDSTRPLFVSLDPALDDDVASSLSIVRNSAPAVFGNAIDKLLYNTQFTVLLNDGAGSPLVECTAYESLIIRIKSAQTQLAPPTALTWFYLIRIEWYDSTKTLIGESDVSLPPAWGSVGSDPLYTRATIPILGTYFKMYVDSNYPPGDDINDLRVVGTTRSVAPGMASGYRDTYCYNPTRGINFMQFTDTLSCSMDLSNFADTSVIFYLPTPKNNIRVAWTYSAGATVAGAINYQSILSSSMRLSSTVAIPVATPIGHTDVILPMFEPIMLQITNPSAPLPATRFLHLTWFD